MIDIERIGAAQTIYGHMTPIEHVVKADAALKQADQIASALGGGIESIRRIGLHDALHAYAALAADYAKLAKEVMGTAG